MVKHTISLLWICASVLGFYVAELVFIESADVRTSITITICGDGIVQNDYESCDEGPSGNLGGYGSSTSERQCAAGCSTFGPYCGDAVLQVRFSEECDDGNNTSGDLCSAICKSETAVPPTSPPGGNIPTIPGADPGTTPASTETRVIARGKAYPGSEVNVLLDGKIIGSAVADSNADFQYNSTTLTPGVATLGFWARDASGTQSITTSIVFEIAQSAVTSVSNIFFPPTIKISSAAVVPGALIELSGQTVPTAKVVTDVYAGARATLESVADASGSWALQIDSASLPRGQHNAKSYFELQGSVRSGYGKSIAFAVGDDASSVTSTDMNNDSRINLVDFSIFLLSWNTSNQSSDYNGDGKVNLADFSILLFNWTG